MRKDSIDKKAIEAAYLIYSERGHKILDYSHDPTDYKRNTVEEKKADSLNLKIDEQQNNLRICRLRGNFQEMHRCMQEMQNMIKEKERLDARMSVAAPGGNAGQKQQVDYNRTYDQSDCYSEMNDIGSQIAALEERMREFMGE